MFQPSQEILRQLETGDTSLAMTSLSPSSVNALGLRELAHVQNKFEREFGPGEVPLLELTEEGLDSVLDALSREKPLRERLEALAIQSIQEEFSITEADLTLRAKLTDLGTIKRTIFPSLNQGIFDLEETTEIVPPHKEEIAKRRIIDAIIQGVARKMQNRFHMDAHDIKELDPGLPGLYSKVMNTNNAVYWIINDALSTATPLGSPLNPYVGLVEFDFSTKPITVSAQAVCFPVLLHELAKGVMGVIGYHGLPSDKTLSRMVRAQADKFEYEPFDLRLGPQVWERISSLLSGRELGVRNMFLTYLFKLPALEFNRLIKTVIEKDDETAKRALQPIIDKATKRI